jgi:hypothetical protein
MKYLWRFRGVVFRWGLFTLVLTGLGWGLHILLPPEPRWTMEMGSKSFYSLYDTKVTTFETQGGLLRGPIQFWDMASGRETGRLATDGAVFYEVGYTKNGRFYVGLVKGNKGQVDGIRWVDVKERREWDIKVRLEKFESAQFSPGCDVAALRQPQPGASEAAYVIVDTSAGRILDRFQIPVVPPANAGIVPATPDDDLNYLSTSLREGIFSHDGGFFAITYKAAGKEHIRLVNTRTGKALVLDDSRLLSLSEDSRTLVAERTGRGGWIWDLALEMWRCRVEGELAPFITFSPDHRLLACAAHESKKNVPVSFFDVQTGKALWQIHCNEGRSLPGMVPVEYETFSPDSRFFLMTAQPQQWHFQLSLYDVQTKQRLWERTWRDRFANTPLFTPDSRTVIATFSDAGLVEIIDAESGQSKFTIPIPNPIQLDPLLSKDGRTLLVDERPGAQPPSFWSELRERFFAPAFKDPFIYHVYDVETGGELGNVRSEWARSWGLTTDRRSLLLLVPHAGLAGFLGQTPNTGATLYCWDIPAAKPLRWVLGVPLGIGLLGLAIAVWRPRRRALRAKAASSMNPPEGALPC